MSDPLSPAGQAPGIPPDPPPAAPAARAWQRRPVILAVGVAAAALVLLGGLFAGGVIGGPSYPHAWCGPLLSTLHSRGTQQSYENALARVKREDHAPVGKLLNDLYAYDVAYAALQNGSVAAGIGLLGVTQAALSRVAKDLQALNRACGQPPDAYKHDTI